MVPDGPRSNSRKVAAQSPLKTHRLRGSGRNNRHSTYVSAYTVWEFRCFFFASTLSGAALRRPPQTLRLVTTYGAAHATSRGAGRSNAGESLTRHQMQRAAVKSRQPVFLCLSTKAGY